MTPISRRTMLQGLGTAIALPWLEAMMPPLSLTSSASAAAAAVAGAPKRLAFVYVPNGAQMAEWTPKAVGAGFDLPTTLAPLQPFKDNLLVLTGLTADKARPHGDGPGDHARAMAAFLTGSQPKKTSGADIKVGVSADQLAAAKIGKETRFSSLEIGCDRGMQAGNCDSGYSCAYSANLSWRSSSTPMAKEIDPRLVFERLFGNGAKEEAQAKARRERLKKSILDSVAEDAGDLRAKLGATDQRKLDEYLSSVREIEQRIARSAGEAPKETPAPAVKPTGIPKDYQEHIHLLCDLLVVAFQGDLTRVSTFVFANEGSNRSFRFIEVPEGHHDLSHHGNNKDKQAKIRKIDRFYTSQLVYLLQKMQSVKEGAGTLLDNILIAYGSGNSDGNRHNHDDLPILLIGKGGGAVKPGRHIRFPKETPVANLWLTMLDKVGVGANSFGDSTGKLNGLSG